MPCISSDLLQPSGSFHHPCVSPLSDFVSMGMLINDTLRSGCLGYPINFQILLNSTIIFLLGIGASFVASLTHLHVAQYQIFHRN